MPGLRQQGGAESFARAGRIAARANHASDRRRGVGSAGAIAAALGPAGGGIRKRTFSHSWFYDAWFYDAWFYDARLRLLQFFHAASPAGSPSRSAERHVGQE